MSRLLSRTVLATSSARPVTCVKLSLPRWNVQRAFIDQVTGVERRHMEAIPRQVRDPAQEIAAHRGYPQIRRNEPDPDSSAVFARTHHGCLQLRHRIAEQRSDQAAVAFLQREIVFALIGKEEVGPVEVEDRLRIRPPVWTLGAQACEAGSEALPPPLQILAVGIDGRKHQRFRDRRMHMRRVDLERAIEDGDGCLGLVLFTQYVREERKQIGKIGLQRAGLAKLDFRGIESARRHVEPAQPGPIVPRVRLQLNGALVAGGCLDDLSCREVLLPQCNPLGGACRQSRVHDGWSWRLAKSTPSARDVRLYGAAAL